MLSEGLMKVPESIVDSLVIVAENQVKFEKSCTKLRLFEDGLRERSEDYRPEANF